MSAAPPAQQQAAPLPPPAAAATAAQPPAVAAPADGQFAEERPPGKCHYFMEKVRLLQGRGSLPCAPLPSLSGPVQRSLCSTTTASARHCPLQKRRHCKFDAIPGKKYCGNHIYFAEVRRLAVGKQWWA